MKLIEPTYGNPVEPESFYINRVSPKLQLKPDKKKKKGCCDK
jgi:hypothetical protein